MIDHTAALYCITADLLKAAGHSDDLRCALTDAEVIHDGAGGRLLLRGRHRARPPLHALDGADAPHALEVPADAPPASLGGLGQRPLSSTRSGLERGAGLDRVGARLVPRRPLR